MTKKNDESRKGLSRRDFFKHASMAAGGGLLLGSLPVGASANVAASDLLKIAVVGCGGRGTGAANQALSTGDGVQLVAMADAFRDRLDESFERLSNRFEGTDKINVPEEHKFTGFDAYQKAIELADVVIFATTPGFRPEHFETAVNAGKHVFMEKPVATDVQGVRRVMEAGKVAEQKGLNVVVGLQRHYQNNYREVVKRVKNYAIGDIVSGQVYWNSGGVWVRERQPNQTEMEYQMRNWYYFNWLCGDHILEQHIHNIDVANWFIGEFPESAQGMGGREVRTGKDHGQIYDHHFVEFTYPSGAVIASQCRHQPNTMSRVDEVFQGTRGTVYTNSSNTGVLKTYGGRNIYDHNGEGDPNPYQQEHDELFASIRSGRVINDTEQGAKSTMSAIIGRMATYSGKVIQWGEAMKSDHRLVPDSSQLGWNVNPPVMPDTEGNYPIPVPGETDVLSPVTES
ncbi:MAG: Gfo/Idh/MocA family oxidoreductase [Balneolaceae bacterium]